MICAYVVSGQYGAKKLPTRIALDCEEGIELNIWQNCCKTILFAIILAITSDASAQMLRVLWIDPYQGPICDGPLGPGQCQIVGQWMQRHGMGATTDSASQPTDPLLTDDAPSINSTMLSKTVNGAAQCAQMTSQENNVNVDTFLACTRGALVLDKDSATIVSCAEQFSSDKEKFASCAGKGILGSRLSTDQMKAINCATKHTNSSEEFAGCVTGEFLAGRLTNEQRGVLNCAINHTAGSTEFAECTASTLLGNRLPREAQMAVACAVITKGDLQSFAGCAANAYLKLNINAEQQIGIQCIVSSGGQPYVAAGCAASRLTFRELTKCAEHGIGGEKGCFGVNNDLVGRNGFVVRNIAALAGGPNSVINDPGQILGGHNSVFNNPRQLLGGPNSVVNQALRNVPSPPPLQVGKIGKHRVCIPWC